MRTKKQILKSDDSNSRLTVEILCDIRDLMIPEITGTPSKPSEEEIMYPPSEGISMGTIRVMTESEIRADERAKIVEMIRGELPCSGRFVIDLLSSLK